MTATLAILGGGQLAQMLGDAAARIGVACRALDPSPEACASRTCEIITGSYDDPKALTQLLLGADALTFEFENVPAESLRLAAESGLPVFPSADALAVASDRLLEKRLFESLGMAVPAYRSIETEPDLDAAASEMHTPLLLKARSGGYDGKSQARVTDPADMPAAWQSISRQPCLAEQLVELRAELSVIVCRGHNGTIATYPPTRNEHSSGILVRSVAPDEQHTQHHDTARAWAVALAECLDYRGVLALELFVTDDGLLANEFAPRVHNTGHWTIEGASTSQFENHIRAVLGMPLGPTEATTHAEMRNLIGSVPTIRLTHDRVTLHNYGKQPREGRKVGHITCLADSAEDAAALADEAFDATSNTSS